MFVLAPLRHQAVLPVGTLLLKAGLNIYNQEKQRGQPATRSGLPRGRVGGRDQVRLNSASTSIWQGSQVHVGFLQGQPRHHLHPCHLLGAAEKTKNPAFHQHFGAIFPAKQIKGNTYNQGVRSQICSSSRHRGGRPLVSHNATTSRRWGQFKSSLCASGRHKIGPEDSQQPSHSAGTGRSRDSLAAGLKQTKGSAVSHRSQRRCNSLPTNLATLEPL